MYLDAKGLVTTGVGNLLEPSRLALGLPWQHLRDGTPATPLQIADAWMVVKARQDLAGHGGGAFRVLTGLWLTDAAIDRLVMGKLTEDDRALAIRFAEYETWPADAQLGLLSLAWACGPMFDFPKLAAAVRTLDWVTAAAECHISTRGNAPVGRRNMATQRCFLNAAAVACGGLDPEVLHYPDVLG
jgi:hypothetical protein